MPEVTSVSNFSAPVLQIWELEMGSRVNLIIYSDSVLSRRVLLSSSLVHYERLLTLEMERTQEVL